MWGTKEFEWLPMTLQTSTEMNTEMAVTENDQTRVGEVSKDPASDAKDSASAYFLSPISLGARATVVHRFPW